MTGSDVTAAVSGKPLPEAGDTQTRLLTSKVDADHPHLTTRPRAWIDPANPTGNPATARDGTAVQLRPLRRDE
jgi:hypothetical protein